MDNPVIGTNKVKLISFLEITIIIAFAVLPLFTSFPYRVNIFLSWEGAYRLSQGQIPFKDFGMPMGYMYWVVPALFFKIFGTQLITLVKAQVFINIVSGLAFRSILKYLGVQPGIRLLAVIVYVLSYSFFNFWPWYNHTVIVYEMAGLAFLFYFFHTTAVKKGYLALGLSAFFIFCSFFTKQDGGALAFVLCCALLGYNSFVTKKWLSFFVFIASFIVMGMLFILPLTHYNFGYWFNHGQPPHTARLSLFDILDEFFGGSLWLKFYLLVIGFIVLAEYRHNNLYFRDRNKMLFLLLTIGIIAEAAILQVTSYTPPDNNIFFHSFAFAFLFSSLARFVQLDFLRPKSLVTGLFCVLIWWSGTFWKYFQRFAERTLPASAAVNTSGENIVNRKTFKIIRDTTDIPESQWRFSNLSSFHKIYLPKPTIDGMNRFIQLTKSVNKPQLRVLNMSELTPLAAEVPFSLERGLDIPLWYHLGVGMFNRQASAYEQKIATGFYDFVLFEYVPSLNNFYPFRVRDSLLKTYIKTDSFPAPRRGDTPGTVEVYRNPKISSTVQL